jgi:hypothetical protein
MRDELVMAPPESVVYEATPSVGVTSVGLVLNTAVPDPVSSEREFRSCDDVMESVRVP